MRRTDKANSVVENRGYQVFKEYHVSTKRKKVDTKQKYVVPWELTDEHFKKSFY